MKLNLPKLLLTAGLSVGIISFASVAEAGKTIQGSSLTGQKTEKQLQQQSQAIGLNGFSLTGQTTDKQPTQSAKGHETSP